MTAVLPERPSTDEMRRRELAAFLRSRRERLRPEQFDLPRGGRRRTPGLRREEVAQLAGVGVTWYTWLEQGRDIHASEQVLDAIARTLMLDPYERTHLFTLAGAPQPPKPDHCNAVPPSLYAMLRQLEPFPAMVRNARCDILACNRAFQWLHDIDKLPFDERNTLLQIVTNPEWQRRLPEWRENLPRVVAQFRASMAEHLGEPAWKTLVKRLRAESPLFEELWHRHDVGLARPMTKRVLHPEAGLLNFEHTILLLNKRSDVYLTTYTPADEETNRKLSALTL